MDNDVFVDIEKNDKKTVNIAEYDMICKDIIDNMDSVKQFTKDFNERYEEIYRFKASNSALYKLMHPIKLSRNRAEGKRLQRIYDTYNQIYNRSVVKYIKEETGDLSVDLHDPTYKIKPNHMDTYVKSIQLKKVRKKCT